MKEISRAKLIARLFPDADRRPPVKIIGEISIVDVSENLGFEIRIVNGTHGHFEAEDDHGNWTAEPDHYVNIGFRFDKEFPREAARQNMLDLVKQILVSGDEDVALLLNGDVLTLIRNDGGLKQFAAGGFWNDISISDAID